MWYDIGIWLVIPYNLINLPSSEEETETKKLKMPVSPEACIRYIQFTVTGCKINATRKGSLSSSMYSLIQSQSSQDKIITKKDKTAESGETRIRSILCRHPSFLVRSSITIRMSSKSIEDVKEQEFSDDAAENQVENDGDQKELDLNRENPMLSPEQEEEIIKKKYGGMLSKKKPLISKDHERAFFDSADWALGKQGAQKPKGPLEALRPKLQPTPQHQMRSRRSAYAPADDDDAEDGGNHASPEHENCESQGGDDKNSAPEDQTCNGGDDKNSAPGVQTCNCGDDKNSAPGVQTCNA
ncbi:hypothetical protein NC653_025697 [Populus alba x Populus x berolinensis]|uniref:cAMP-regulated phosphoprotein 19-related protein n=3 Tax=Populus TaxID=3689 RepID=A0A4U5MX63_POPAL|nr:hypothetical protein NC653_025697 [Populus alba x Populus x berolinensis]TKR74418.1 hypothetical protein D5086_0000294510 [Populus alba]